jgi:predicted histidine transporter YuiF (NhaC family)
MGMGDALRSLDDRVLGVPKRTTAAAHRSTFFVGLVGTLVVLVILSTTGRSTALAALGPFVVFMISGGVGWRRSRERQRKQVPSKSSRS